MSRATAPKLETPDAAQEVFDYMRQLVRRDLNGFYALKDRRTEASRKTVGLTKKQAPKR